MDELHGARVRDPNRLVALRRLGLLDTPAEEAFDRLTRLVAAILQVPVALVSLVDADRQFFKSALGVAEPWASRRETPLSHSFCQYAVASGQPLVVEDARKHELVCDNPAIPDMDVVAYAGIPLITRQGLALGSLCAIDSRPRSWQSHELAILQDLAASVMTEIELRAEVQERQRAEQALQAALRQNSQLAVAVANLATGVVITDPHLPDNPIVFANPGFEALTGYAQDEVLGRNCRLLQGRDTDAAVVGAMREALHARRRFEGDLLNYRKDGSAFWNHLEICPVYGADGALVNFVGLQTDISARIAADLALREARNELERRVDERTAALRALSRRLLEVQEGERRHLARELHDAIGQQLTGLKFLLQSLGRAPLEQQDARLAEAQALVNELMVHLHDLSLDLRPAMLDDLGLLPTLIWHFERYTRQTGVRVDFSSEGLERRFPAPVETAVYRIVQEALTNVARHAGTQTVQVQIWAGADVLSGQVVDQGAGFDATALAARQRAGLGGMRERARLLAGTLEVETAPGTGTRIAYTIPLDLPEEPRTRRHDADDSACR